MIRQDPSASFADVLLAQRVHGVFFMAVEQPFRWDDAADKEALLDYAYAHLRFTALNDAMCEQLGAPRDRVLGMTPRDRWEPERARWRQYMRTLYDHGHASHRARVPRVTGAWHDVDGEYACTYDGDGRITGHYGIQRDTTAARRAAERLELALEAGGISIWELDVAAGTLEIDPRSYERLGYPADGAPWPETWGYGLLDAADLAAAQRAFADYLAGRAPRFAFEHRVRAADGSWRWFASSGRITARDDAGRPLRVVGTSTDITARMQLQDRLTLSERLASIGTLAAGIGHEINNPLTYVALNLTLIERELARPEPSRDHLHELLAQAREGTERVTGVVRDLQLLTRGPDDAMIAVELEPVLRRSLAIAGHRLRDRARVALALEPVPPVRGGAGRLIQVFVNLLVNAAQAIPEGAAEHHTVAVAARMTEDGAVEVAVSDTGAGIAPEVRDRIFDPFFTTKAVGEGTGLGLAICHRIVEALGGQIAVDSTPGQGATFRVRLPVAP